MKEYKIKYIQGHIIDVVSKKRVILKQNLEYTIEGEEDSFSFEDPRLFTSHALSSKDKEEALVKKHKKTEIVKILDKDSELLFRVGNSKLVRKEESKEYVFAAKLLEDLYIFKTRDGDRKSVECWRLADCQCQLVACLYGSLTLHQDLFANSLNQLFSFTVQFYFPFQRTGGTNVYSAFVLGSVMSSISINPKLHGFVKLDEVRREALDGYLKKGKL